MDRLNRPFHGRFARTDFYEYSIAHQNEGVPSINSFNLVLDTAFDVVTYIKTCAIKALH